MDPHSRTRLLALALTITLGCATGEPEPDRFGDRGSPAPGAGELLSKSDPITSDGIAGVYETTGSITRRYQTISPHGVPGSVFDVTSDYVKRVELRTSKISTALQCTFTYSEHGQTPNTLLAFVQQDAEARLSFYRIAAPGTSTETDPVSKVTCAIDQPAETWTYCEERALGSGDFTHLPKGANLCIGRLGQSLLRIESGRTTVIGKKVAN
jgi:hypothetical protein